MARIPDARDYETHARSAAGSKDRNPQTDDASRYEERKGRNYGGIILSILAGLLLLWLLKN